MNFWSRVEWESLFGNRVLKGGAEREVPGGASCFVAENESTRVPRPREGEGWGEGGSVERWKRLFHKVLHCGSIKALSPAPAGVPSGARHAKGTSPAGSGRCSSAHAPEVDMSWPHRQRRGLALDTMRALGSWSLVPRGSGSACGAASWWRTGCTHCHRRTGEAALRLQLTGLCAF